ncbi:MAG: BofC C-terminal domain-containing protein [Clostridia bacterium]|nr:BofC C-terminal domain-containing protein [Clostridia bacterium]
MEKPNNLKTYLVIIMVAVSITAIIVTIGFVVSSRKENPASWVLHSYGNNVALYNGDQIIEVYGSIMLDTLPTSDKKQLDNGIAFSTREEAVSAIEDYDG